MMMSTERMSLVIKVKTWIFQVILAGVAIGVLVAGNVVINHNMTIQNVRLAVGLGFAFWFVVGGGVWALNGTDEKGRYPVHIRFEKTPEHKDPVSV